MGAYRGQSTEQRRAERRARLLTAGLDLWGELGWQAVTVRGVCARAGLTDRYFYENFADRDALLLAVFDQVGDRLRAVVLEHAWAGGPREIMYEVFTDLLTELAADPRKARIGVLESAGSTALVRRRHDALAAMAELLSERVSAFPGVTLTPETVRVQALFCVGGVGELISAWLGGRLEATVDELARSCTTLCAAAFQVP